MSSESDELPESFGKQDIQFIGNETNYCPMESDIPFRYLPNTPKNGRGPFHVSYKTGAWRYLVNFESHKGNRKKFRSQDRRKFER